MRSKISGVGLVFKGVLIIIISLRPTKKMAAELSAKKPRTAQCGPPPVYESIQDLSGGSLTNENRYKGLVAAFETRFGTKPKFLARAPGRVNIVGEHVDYSGYGVLPMAIEQDIAIASCPNDRGELCFYNVSDKHPEFSCRLDVLEKDIDKNEIVWYKYILCGIKGMIEEFGIKTPIGMDIAVDGSIPPSSGLSSSSALVCCSALTTLSLNEVDLPSKKELAEMCAKSERLIGTQGGGMDQAISFLGEAGKALMIEFNPVRSSEVDLPEGYSFIISNTLVRANKAAESDFNTRVAECHIGARVVAKKKGKNWREVNRLMLLQNSLDSPLNEMSGVVCECLHPGEYTRKEICEILEISNEELVQECLSEKSKGVEKFKLQDRAKHVFEEANRVYLFNSTANSGGGTSTAQALGRLMDESHTSCSKIYQCSCAELDELVSLCKEAGALGSRLTGAGWGGCAVSLVSNDNIQAFQERVKEGYFKKYNHLSDLPTSLFATKPSPGAGVCRFIEKN